ncbi:hypothetical protein ACJX0J_011310 [Zea mays]
MYIKYIPKAEGDFHFLTSKMYRRGNFPSYTNIMTLEVTVKLFHMQFAFEEALIDYIFSLEKEVLWMETRKEYHVFWSAFTILHLFSVMYLNLLIAATLLLATLLGALIFICFMIYVNCISLTID